MKHFSFGCFFSRFAAGSGMQKGKEVRGTQEKEATSAGIKKRTSTFLIVFFSFLSFSFFLLVVAQLYILCRCFWPLLSSASASVFTTAFRFYFISGH